MGKHLQNLPNTETPLSSILWQITHPASYLSFLQTNQSFIASAPWPSAVLTRPVDHGLTIYEVSSTSAPGNGWYFPSLLESRILVPSESSQKDCHLCFYPSALIRPFQSSLAAVSSACTQVYLGGCRVKQESCLSSPRGDATLVWSLAW